MKKGERPCSPFSLLVTSRAKIRSFCGRAKRLQACQQPVAAEKNSRKKRVNEKTGLYKTKFILTNAYLCSANLKNNILMLKRLFGLLLCCSMLTAYAETISLSGTALNSISNGNFVYTDKRTGVTFTLDGEKEMKYGSTGVFSKTYHFTLPQGTNPLTWTCPQNLIGKKKVKVSQVVITCKSQGVNGSTVRIYDDNGHTSGDKKPGRWSSEIVTMNGEPKDVAYIEVKTNGIFVTKFEVKYTLEDVAVTISDNEDISGITPRKYDIVTIDRAFSRGWNTVCLPFNTTAASLCEGAVAQRFVSYDAEKGLTFERIEAMEANVPYLIRMPEAVDAGKVLTNVEVVAPQAGSVTSNGMTFSGNYKPDFHVDGMYGVVTDGEGTSRIVRGGSSAYVNGTRAYFTLADGQSLGSTRLHFDTEADAPTAIGSIEAAPAEQRPVTVYDAAGRLLPHAKANLEGLPRGIYIVGGRKVIK